MKYKILLLMMLLLVASAIADVTEIDSITITAPVSGGGVNSTTFLFQGTYAGNSSTGRISVYFNTSNISTALMCSNLSLSGNDGSWTCVADTTTANTPDSCAQTISARFINATGAATDASTNTTQTSVIWDNTVPRIDTFALDKSIYEIYKTIPYELEVTDGCDTHTQLSYEIRVQRPDSSVTDLLTKGRTGKVSGTDIYMIGLYNVSAFLQDRVGNRAGTNVSSQVTFRTKGRGVPLEAEQMGVTPTQIVKKATEDNTKQVFVIGSIAAIVMVMGAGVFFFMLRR